MLVLMADLAAWDKLGGNGESIVLEGLSQMVGKVLNGALASGDGLDEETEHREHGKAAILDLLHLQVRWTGRPNSQKASPKVFFTVRISCTSSSFKSA